MRMYPTERDQIPLLRELQNQLLFIHRASITRRVLLGNQQRGNHILLLLIPAQQQPARFPIPARVQRRDTQEPRERITRERDGFELAGGGGFCTGGGVAHDAGGF